MIFYFFIFCIQNYFEAIHLKMNRNPYRYCFDVQKNHITSAKCIDVNVKRRFLTRFSGIYLIFFEKRVTVTCLKNWYYFRWIIYLLIYDIKALSYLLRLLADSLRTYTGTVYFLGFHRDVSFRTQTLRYMYTVNNYPMTKNKPIYHVED